MSSAIINFKMPMLRMLTAKEAAEYCGVPRKRFPITCQVAPVQMPDGDLRWDVRDLDIWLDGLKMGAANGDDDIVGKLTG